jgi:hypothetical protein
VFSSSFLKEANHMSQQQIDTYAALVIISAFSGFCAAMGTEFARFLLSLLKERIKKAKNNHTP